MKLQVHLGQRLLHVLDVRGGIFEQALALAQIRAQFRDLGFGLEAGAQQAIGMEPLEPLGILHVCLAPGHLLGVARIDQKHLEAAILQDLEDRDPVNAGRFHDDAGDATNLEPVGQPVQVGGKGPEAAHGFVCPVRSHGRHVHGGPNIDGCGMGMNQRQALPLFAGNSFASHRLLLGVGGAGLRQRSTS
jgi:hypothetical protein